VSKVERSDIEKKLRDIQGDLDDAAGAAKPTGIAVGGSVFVGVVGLAYILGQRKARKRTTVVEIRRT
jgi:hypothetical protein